MPVVTDRVYFVNSTLWASYLPGCGETCNIRNFNTFLTDKKDDSHYDTIAEKILQYAENNIPNYKSKKGKIFKIPVFYSESEANKNKNSIGHYWLTLINENNYSILSFFKKNNEAIYWIKQDF
jgi:predicted PolB exonuclease-like 3'-5' exonuclease